MRLPPLGLYIHIPWCVQKCPYCDFNSHALKSGLPEQEYIAHLLADLEQDARLTGERPVETIFIGGGTPSRAIVHGAGDDHIVVGRQHRGATTAHPDDLETGCGGLVAKVIANGGSVTNRIMVKPSAEQNPRRDQQTVSAELEKSKQNNDLAEVQERHVNN